MEPEVVPWDCRASARIISLISSLENPSDRISINSPALKAVSVCGKIFFFPFLPGGRSHSSSCHAAQKRTYEADHELHYRNGSLSGLECYPKHFAVVIKVSTQRSYYPLDLLRISKCHHSSSRIGP